MDGLHDHLARFNGSFLSSDHSHSSVNDMWVCFVAVERFIPSKMTKTKYSLPWIDSSIKRLVRNVINLTFVLASQAAQTLRAIANGSEHMFKRDAYWKHISNIFSFETENPALEKMRR